MQYASKRKRKSNGKGVTGGTPEKTVVPADDTQLRNEGDDDAELLDEEEDNGGVETVSSVNTEPAKPTPDQNGEIQMDATAADIFGDVESDGNTATTTVQLSADPFKFDDVANVQLHEIFAVVPNPTLKDEWRITCRFKNKGVMLIGSCAFSNGTSILATNLFFVWAAGRLNMEKQVATGTIQSIRIDGDSRFIVKCTDGIERSVSECAGLSDMYRQDIGHFFNRNITT
jgi:hypothetical protein